MEPSHPAAVNKRVHFVEEDGQTKLAWPGNYEKPFDIAIIMRIKFKIENALVLKLLKLLYFVYPYFKILTSNQ